MAPTVSVIVPNYNYARYLPQRLESIFNQTYDDYEVIILDDKSTDDSAAVIEQYRSHPKVSKIVINSENSGSPFIQWEKGLGYARGKYAWIAEADDLMEPTFLEKAVKVMEEGPGDMRLTMALSYIIDGDGNITDRKGYDRRIWPTGGAVVYSGSNFIAANMWEGNGVYNASQVLFSIDAFKQVANTDYRKMRYCGDWLFWIEIVRNGNVGVIREKLNRFRKHGKSVTDEGHAKLDAAMKESRHVQTHILSSDAAIPAGVKRMLRYRIARALKCDFSNPALQMLNINSRNFVWLWIYKHWFFSGSYRKTIEALHPLAEYD
ncbi:MAG: glycosyltransferase family 2 protein [Muribaculaceae bacterium]|nr:glycosyltransferase family 2 protein [Bacteroidales bacterium]MDY4810565.1 glycosyltransferase family 2 protein [Muribaculaceae bacterium]